MATRKAATRNVISIYNHEYDGNTESLVVEMDAIRRIDAGGTTGYPLSFHYEQMRKLLWPNLDDHRWHRLIRDTIVNNKCTILAGPASSGKTHEAAWIFLCEYFIYPQETCILVSSTDLRGLRGRIWSEITMLWQDARDRYDWLPGNLLDSKVAILTDSLDEDEYEKKARNYRKCIQGVPCREGGTFVGLNRYSGWKQKRMRLVADEAQMMAIEFVKGITNLNANVNFKCVIMGNFNDPMDCLGRCSEPTDGWSAHMQPMKTEVWDTFYPLEGKCVNLIGFDSPNNDWAKDHPGENNHFPYMIGPKKIAEIERSFGRESIEFMSQCWGAMKVSTLAFKVLTREICDKGRAFDDPIWGGEPLTTIIGLDASWGGDRCCCTKIQFGKDVNGQVIVDVSPPAIVPLAPQEGQEVDYAIAEWVRDYCERNQCPPENFFHDSTGRGTLGTVLGRVWSTACNPVEFGGRPTDRPVSSDYFWNDPKTGQRRQKLCSEHYVKFVTELWFSVRYAVEAGQIRNLPPEVFEEFCLRIWKRVANDKIEIEPKSGTSERPGMKQRVGRSPDLADSLAIAIEGARRRGFQIARLVNTETMAKNRLWIHKLADEQHKLRTKGNLVFDL